MTPPVTPNPPITLEYIAGYLADRLSPGYWPEAAALIRAAQELVTIAREVVNGEEDRVLLMDRLGQSLAVFDKLESGE